MKIPIKFKVNTDDFKVYFDNNKKTHVCENVETGEQTNIGVLGILMQMGILKPIEENRGMEDRIKFLSERIDSLENKIDEAMKNVNVIPARKKEVKEIFEEPAEEEIEEEVEEPEEKEEKPKSEIKKRIMKNVLKQTEEEPVKEEKEEPEKDEEEESDAVVESDDEIDNWMRI